MTLDQLIQQARERLLQAINDRRAAADAVTACRTRIISAATVTDADEAEVNRLVEARQAADALVDTCEARMQELLAERDRDVAVDRLANEVGPAAPRPAYDRVARVGQEERVYRPDTDPQGRQFLRDIGRAFLQPHNHEVRDRLERHDRIGRVEYRAYMERAAGTGAFAGLTVPQYLTEMYAPLARTLRPLADAMNGHPLPPDGMTLNLSQITTGTTTAVQASENSAVSETNIDDTLLTINVQTNAGQQTLSRQAVERGTGTEDVTMQDLFRAYNSTLDSTLINQATNGLSAAATAVTYTDASPTVAEFYPNLIAGLAGVEGAMLNMASGDNLCIMHSRRWYWMSNALSTSWPLISQPGIAAQMMGTNFAEAYGRGVRGVLPNGTPVIVDNNVPTNLGGGTNQDEAYLVDRMECHLWEDPDAPVFIRAEQPAAAALGILFVLYGFFAYTFARYAQARKVTGTGLVTPAFTGV